MMKISPGGVLALKQSEGCRLDAYQDEAGVWTIGYGDTGAVKPGDRITVEEAESRFVRRVQEFERAVLGAVKRPVSQGQFDALVSLCYNIGIGQFTGSELVRLFNADDLEAAARQFGRWIHVSGDEVTVRQGDKGPNVVDWQRRLVLDGFEVRVDGDFGAKTTEATRLWHAKHDRRATDTSLGVARKKVISANLVQRRFWEIVRFLRA
jgi:lysozyme